MSSLPSDLAGRAGHAHEHTHLLDHEHGPDHDHDHDHVAEAGTPPQGGPVILDIGDDVGALIVQLDAGLVGTEIHVRLEDQVRTTHTGVWPRQVGAAQVVVAVFPELIEGHYDLLDVDGQPMLALDIGGGAVTELDLRTG